MKALFLLSLPIGVRVRDIRCFAVQRRNRQTLQPIIERNVAPGTTIRSDQWRAYSTISQWAPGYTHETVNHSENFVDPVSGAHTQSIERAWLDLKNGLLRTEKGISSRENLPARLAEFWFLTLNKNSSFWAFLEAVRKQFPVD